MRGSAVAVVVMATIAAACCLTGCQAAKLGQQLAQRSSFIEDVLEGVEKLGVKNNSENTFKKTQKRLTQGDNKKRQLRKYLIEQLITRKKTLGTDLVNELEGLMKVNSKNQLTAKKSIVKANDQNKRQDGESPNAVDTINEVKPVPHNHAPVFNVNHFGYYESIYADDPPGTIAVKTHAEDPDGDELRYSLKPYYRKYTLPDRVGKDHDGDMILDYLAINEATGDVYLKKQLDFPNPPYTLECTAQVSDQRKDNKSTTIYVQVGVQEPCAESSFMCESWKGRKCIDASLRCDGEWDCVHQEDEIGCPCPFESDFVCETTMFPHTCLPDHVRCNGVSDCKNNEDETDCEKEEATNE